MSLCMIRKGSLTTGSARLFARLKRVSHGHWAHYDALPLVRARITIGPTEARMATKNSAALDTFFSDLERASLDIPGSAGRPVVRPKEQLVRPFIWKDAEVQRLLKKSEHVKLGERRMLRFVNPGTPDWKYVTPTLSVSIQQILPGELAVPHRHTANAIRFFLRGKSYTTVEEDKCEMERGDLIVTPGWEWHDYGNEGTEPGVWIDALDLPLIQYLDSCGYLKSIEEEIGYEGS